MSFKIKFDKKLFVLWSCVLFILLLECTIKWIGDLFGRINMDEVSLMLQVGMGGVDAEIFWSFIRKVILRSALWSVILTAVCGLLRKYKIVPILTYVGLVVVLGMRIVDANIQFGSFFNTTVSDFYEREYVFPENTKITFKNKRNVLMIALESMEKPYADENLFGAGGLTPHITQMERDNVSFEDYRVLSGLSHTIAAITGMVTGLPLFFSSYKSIEKMLGASGIGNVFVKNGYQTWSFFPASGKFSLKENFLRRMGFENIFDGVRLRAMLDYELDVIPFEGIDDGTLFEMTRPMIADIIKSGQPYFIFMETINTHCKGYYTQYCRDLGFKQENMEDIAKCEDKIIADFVEWFRTQDPTAVVILVNDHMQHSGDIMKKLSPLGSRALNNVFINADNVFQGVDTSRPVAAFDFFPTVIEAAGGIVPGCRLGLGTAMSARCAGVKTLREKYGDMSLQELMEQKNDLYYKLSVGGETNDE